MFESESESVFEFEFEGGPRPACRESVHVHVHEDEFEGVPEALEVSKRAPYLAPRERGEVGPVFGAG